MKAVISGDWHIRIKPDLPEQWQLNRYRWLIQEIITLCKEHEACLFLTGDILDRNRPSLLEMQLLIELLTEVTSRRIDIWLISGNHEAIGQGESTFDYLLALFEVINKQDRGQIYYSPSNLMFREIPSARLRLIFVGHPALADAFTYNDLSITDDFTMVLVTHFRPTINQFIKEEIDVERLISGYDYTFASDIHTPLELPGNLIYTNHPLNSSFEASPDCGCLLMECVKGEVSWQRIPLGLPNLIQITTTAADFREPLNDYHYYRVEILGTPEELRQIKSDLPNVKLLKVPDVQETYLEQETEEIRDTTLEEGLIEYMAGLGMGETKIERMMGVYREP